MEGPERFEDDFANEWQGAFDDFSQEPPERVWENIDRELTYQKMVYYKRSSRIFQYLSAAVILLASFLGVYIFLNNNTSSIQNNIALSDIDHPTLLNNENVKIPYELTNTSRLYKNELRITEIKQIASKASEYSNDFISLENENDETSHFSDSDFKSIVAIEEFDDIEAIKPNLGIALASNIEDYQMYRLADYSYLSKSRKKNKSNSSKGFWAGVDVGSSSFDPNYVGSNNNTLNTSIAPNSLQFSGARTDAVESQSPALVENMTSGNAINLGVNFGMNISEKWTLTSGLVYNQSEATNSTNVVVRSSQVQEAIPASQEFKNVGQVNSLVDANDVVEYDFEDVSLTNKFQFASVPLRAGYRLYDNRISIEINAGFAANLYLGNKLSDKNNEFADVTIGPGEQSAYREISFSGLAGLQLGYTFLNNFEVVLQPNYQRYLNTLTKESTDFQAIPSGFGLSTGLRYRIN